MGISLCPPAPNQTHTLTELLHSGPLLDFDLLLPMLFFNGCLDLPSLQMSLSQTLVEKLMVSVKAAEPFPSIVAASKLLQWFHLDCVEITEMPYI
ncbi:hypothetical protein HID58_093286 [Brassica napus]|uniref:Uncharacterized protein n=1 Tax=Brassica napus TaxID=3708 RepID=A0ABQ7XD45_BRANA|nr:hypothetical protein HID58_093286 [Brassica napus]